MTDEHTFGQFRTATATLALIAQLQTDRQTRDTRGLYFVEGVRNFVTAVDYHIPIEVLVYSERLLTVPIARKFVRRLKRAGVPHVPLSPEQFRSISRTERASGVGAILRQQLHDIGSLPIAAGKCWIALRQVRSPGNFGTLIRTAAAVGASGFLLIGNAVDPYDAAVIRASMGACFTQHVARTSLAQLHAWARPRQIQIVGASPDGTVTYTDAAYRRPLVLLLGAERAGLTAEERVCCDQLVRIPMVAGADSLNLGVAGSLLLYEVFRSREPHGLQPDG